LRGPAALALALLIASLAGASHASSALELHELGRVEEALAQTRGALAQAEAGGERRSAWTHLMQLAWLEESTGEHKKAIHHATRALELARSLEAPFETGRSLCWLGWSYTSLGLYPLALEFYGEAIALATRGDRIALPGVWGLATQETGAIYMRLGDLEAAKTLIGLTTDYARHHGIDVGVAEGAAHLARIAAEQGDLLLAEQLADEALSAALRCGCSPFNTARAYTVAARTALERARLNPKLRDHASQRAHAALEYARGIRDRRHVAEALLLSSYTLDPDDFEGRMQRVSSAVELLLGMESELRGTAEARLGSLFLESEQADLAERYLASGLEINRELFRELDSAYIRADLAEVDAARGASEASLEGWESAAAQARASGALPLVLHNEERLSEELQQLGYLQLSLDWSERALATLEALLAQAPDRTARERLLERQLALSERIAEIRLELEREPPPPVPAPR
jgi:tetratricopeptide (TPR) repeat protein